MKAIILFFGEPNSSEDSNKLNYYEVINMVNAVDTNVSAGSETKVFNVYREMITSIKTAPPEIEVFIKGHQTNNNINFKKLSRLFWKLAKKQQKAKKEE